MSLLVESGKLSLLGNDLKLICSLWRGEADTVELESLHRNAKASSFNISFHSGNYKNEANQ